ncbi:uncharacterized protein LOC121999483 [Zingiber officinale]|uniref:uncharacterized protein LOC121999483 n=1 Tax=Zingiber officinale TaxID=94328 RepID=UPI001C4B9FD0|nr:uncharacterized protein LOC121999483 [Zingiber officinale]
MTMNENALGNNQMKSPTIQKDLTRACAAEVTNVILNDIKDNIFSLMVIECRDISVNEQMRVVLRYMNKHGCVIERFLTFAHASDTSVISLKKTIDELFGKHKLSLSRLRGQDTTKLQICKILDMMIQEMNNQFSKSSMEELTYIACLDPKDSFSQFDIGKLLHLAELYLEDFSLTDRVILENQLETYIQNVRGEFSMMEDLGSLAKKIVETGKNTIFSLVYRLIEIALVLPVATAFVERGFFCDENYQD